MPGHRDDGIDQRTRRQALKQLGGLGLSAATVGCFSGAPERCDNPPPMDPASEPIEARRKLLAGIDTFVVVMMENRSFDHLLGALKMDANYPARALVEGLTGQEANMDAQGQRAAVRARMTDIEADGLKPRWTTSHAAWNGGRNDGFARANPAHVDDVMAYHDRRMAPFQYALADRYCVCDHWFASVMGPTWPNRFYLQAGTSFGRKDNAPVKSTSVRTVWEAMAMRCRSYKCYFAGAIAWYSMAFAGKALAGTGAMVPERIERFFRDARNGQLPEFSIIDPDYEINDLHPPRKMVFGEAFLAAIVRAIEESPQWSRTLLVITYDEHGAFYDHVPPPLSADGRPDFKHLGFRVPAILVGPTVRRGVVSTPFEHVSVMSTLRTRFGIEALGDRVDAVNDLSSCIDPKLVDAPPPARMRGIDPIQLSLRELRACCGFGGGHEDMEAALREGRLPSEHIDPRDPDVRAQDWLRAAQELEVVRVLK